MKHTLQQQAVDQPEPSKKEDYCPNFTKSNMLFLSFSAGKKPHPTSDHTTNTTPSTSGPS